MRQITEIRCNDDPAGRAAGARADGPSRGPRPVVVGYDGSEAARRALARAGVEAGAGGRVIVVTALPSSEALAVVDEAAESALREAQRRVLEEAAALVGAHDLRVSIRTVEAAPAEALIEAARDVDARLIVVGARGDSFVARVVRGSVPEKLATRAPCDVLVVR